MVFKKVMRYDRGCPKFRLFRAMWEGPEITLGGWPVSHKLALALRPRLFRFTRDYDGWRLVLFGVEVHRARSHGGRFV